jgi:hypothetical protein
MHVLIPGVHMQQSVNRGVCMKLNSRVYIEMQIDAAISRYWPITKIVDKTHLIRMYVFQDKAEYNCKDIFQARDACLLVQT